MNDHAARYVPVERPATARYRLQSRCTCATALPFEAADPRCRTVSWKILALLAALLAVLVSTPSRANQVYKACGPKWVKQVKKLEAEKLSWLLEQRTASISVDLDADGVMDVVELTSTPSFRNCDIRHMWDRKETTVRIRYGNGRSRLFHWISDQLVEKMVIYRGIGRILLVGTNAGHASVNKWVELREGHRTPPPATLASQAPVSQVEEGPLQVAKTSHGATRDPDQR